jgi:hypothetical protein
MKTSSLLAAVVIAAPVVWGRQRDCSDVDLCLTSFQWCDLDASSQCTYPPDAYPFSTYFDDHALLAGNNYTISWQAKNDKIAVRFRWHFFGVFSRVFSRMRNEYVLPHSGYWPSAKLLAQI